MADKVKQKKIICRGGLSTNNDTLVLSEEYPGKASQLINFEPSEFGGYRRIDGFTLWDSSAEFVPGTGATLGVFIFGDNVYASRASTTSPGGTYKVFVHTTAVGWSTATTVALSTGGSTANPLVYNNGTQSVVRIRAHTHNYTGTETIVFTDGVNFPYKYNSTTWTSINQSTADLLGAKYSTSFKNHTFFAGMIANKNNLVYSAPNTDDNFGPGSGTGVINAGFTIQGLAVFREYLYVFGSDIIKRVSGKNSTDFALEDVTVNIGCVAPDSIIELGGDVIYMSADGIRTVSGTDKIGDVNLETISEDIRSAIQTYKDAYNFTNIVGVVLRKKSQFRMFIYSTAEAVADANGIIGGIRYPSPGVKTWEFGRLLGIKANCADSGFINGSEVLIHGDSVGRVFEQESGTSFNGADITSVFTTPYLDFDNTETLKSYIRCHVFLKPEGPVTLYAGLKFDWDDPNVPVPANFSAVLSNITSLYDDANVLYDAAGIVYDGSGRLAIRFDIEGAGSSIKYSFVNSSATTRPFSIQGYVTRYLETDSLRGY